jgi:lysylphosphatidylglycerol synthetase-like protein (DUF2156 family)
MVHKVKRQGLEVSATTAAAARPEVDAQLEEISREWLADRRLGEMGFSLGRFSLDALDEQHVFLARQGERVLAFTTWRPTGRAAPRCST